MCLPIGCHFRLKILGQGYTFFVFIPGQGYTFWVFFSGTGQIVVKKQQKTLKISLRLFSYSIDFSGTFACVKLQFTNLAPTVVHFIELNKNVLLMLKDVNIT